MNISHNNFNIYAGVKMLSTTNIDGNIYLIDRNTVKINIPAEYKE